jgi:hypothetical protein
MTQITSAPESRTEPGLFSRFIGVLLSPRETFQFVAAQPKWIGMLALVVLVTAGATAVFFSTEVGQQAYLDESLRRAEASGAQITDQAYEAIERMAPYMAYMAAGGTLISVPLMSFILAGILFAVFSGLGGDASFKQVLAIVAHSGAVSVLGQLFVHPLNYARESMSSATNLAVFFPMLDEGSVPGRFLGMIDLFLVWWTLVLAIGMAVLYRRKTRPVAIAFLAVYGVIALAVAAIMAAWSGS